MKLLSPSEIGKRILPVVAGDPAIDVVYLFGSIAGGSPRPSSDIDIGLLLTSSVREDEYFDLRVRYISRLSAALEADRVDVVVLNNAPSLLAFEALKQRHVVFERDPVRRVGFETGVVGTYLDFLPMREVRRSYVKEQLARGDFFG